MKTLIHIAILLASLLLVSCSSDATQESPASSAPSAGALTPVPTPTPPSAASTSPTSAPTQAAPTPTQTPQPTATSTSTTTQAAPSPAPQPTPEPTQKTPPPTGPLAPELVGTQEWINSDPLEIGDLRGKVVLVDFWTYTCINCIRTLPYMKVWHSKYADDGLVIIGVHTPEFRFEHEIENVKEAVADYSLTWPIVQDNHFATWRAFNNRYWPAKYLIDQNGVLRYRHYGEGAYIETEAMIRELLEERGSDIFPDNPVLAPNQDLAPAYKKDRGAPITAELYLGYAWSCSLHNSYSNSYIAAQDYCESRDQIVEYTAPSSRENHALYLQGSWLVENETLRHGRETTNYEDSVLLRFSAKSANVFLSPQNDDNFKVLVTLDGEYLDESNKGHDVIIESDGKSYLIVDVQRQYSVVNAPEYGTYELELSSNSSDFNLFSFTFGVFTETT